MLFIVGAFLGVIAGVALVSIFSVNPRERDDEGATP